MRRATLFAVLLAGCASAGTSVHGRPTATPSLVAWWPMAFRVLPPVARVSAPVPPASVEIAGTRFQRFPNDSQWLYLADVTQRLHEGTWGCIGDSSLVYRQGFRVTIPTAKRGAIVQAGILASTPPCQSFVLSAYTVDMQIMADSARWALRSVLVDSTKARYRVAPRALLDTLPPATKLPLPVRPAW